VNEGRFRSDLYYRLAVVQISLPPLRDRPEDIPGLVANLLDRLGADPAEAARLRTPDLLARLSSAPWPGNVRELRNYLERCLVFQEAVPLEGAPTTSATTRPLAPFSRARKDAIETFERSYLEQLLARHDGKVPEAAAEAGVGRVYLYKLLARHGIKPVSA
jgi:DNA-binding NtrC family response regulator